MKIENIKVGDVVYTVDSDRYRKSPLIREGKVTRVGSKYIYVKIDGQSDELAFKYKPNVKKLFGDARGWKYLCYFSRQAIDDEEEYNRLLVLFRKEFDLYHKSELSLDQLRAMAKIAFPGCGDKIRGNDET